MKPFIAAQQAPWGGKRLAASYGKHPEHGTRIAESWELSDHPNGRSQVAEGPFAGRFFGDLVREFPREMCGLDAAPARFPLLIKYIDAAEPLSVQVHPDDALAARSGERGKTECWYIMDCAPGAEVILGLRAGTPLERLRLALATGDPSELLVRHRIHRGSFVRVPAGTIHAILGGTLLCEIQQSSDLTYRLWDWNRKPTRPLQVELGLEATKYPLAEGAGVIDTAETKDESVLVANEFFEVRLLTPAEKKQSFQLDNRHGLIVNVVGGSGIWSVGAQRTVAVEKSRAICAGQTWFLPAGLSNVKVVPAGEDLRILVTRPVELG